MLPEQFHFVPGARREPQNSHRARDSSLVTCNDVPGFSSHHPAMSSELNLIAPPASHGFPTSYAVIYYG